MFGKQITYSLAAMADDAGRQELCAEGSRRGLEEGAHAMALHFLISLRSGPKDAAHDARKAAGINKATLPLRFGGSDAHFPNNTESPIGHSPAANPWSNRWPKLESGFEAASRSFGEVTGFQAMAAELTDFSKRRWEDVFHAWEQLLRARHFGEVHTQYAQRAYDAYLLEMSKLGEMYLGAARDASKTVEQTSRRFT
jgi:Phasin protein